MGATDPLVEVSRLYVARGGNPVLRDVSLTVDPGETVAVVGGNGSGKSTLISAIVGLLPFQEGDVALFGTPLRQFRQWRRIGYVPQHSGMQLPNATVREVVSSGRLPHTRPFLPMRADDRRAVAHALEVVGLADRAHWPFAALSGGQKQRTLIARALCTEPELFVMDEPMAGVDLHSQEGLAALLSGLVHEDGKALLVVLHETGTMRIDKRVTLCDGRVTDVDHEAEASEDHPHPDPPRSNFGFSDPISQVAR